ncbi:hypothetical protein CJ739_3411 [Mariniflexile rhizosphaerae]|uniref:hypothetical protein n=1 Tax=unclassified Mariniflexile TaxID=2643887 RepID=UPI000E331B50|nr:hypothetical protein [Mariniflexile sp. TRM1-10]AXP82473.1 hypothetical protein CJ739_3411 [Mariniflexile sp. TRM1-10]
MIFTCPLNSPPLKGGVDSVSLKETGDEVVLVYKIFNPSVFDFFLGNQIHLPLKKREGVVYCFNFNNRYKYSYEVRGLIISFWVFDVLNS